MSEKIGKRKQKKLRKEMLEQQLQKEAVRRANKPQAPPNATKVLKEFALLQKQKLSASLPATASKKPHPLLGGGVIAGVARTVTLPMSYVSRLPDPYQQTPVATAQPFIVTPVTNTDTYAGDVCLGGGLIAGVSRDPLRSRMVTWQNVTGGTWNYHAMFASTGALNTLDRSFGRLCLDGVKTGIYQLKPQYIEYYDGPMAYGTRQYGATDNLGDRSVYLWIDASVGHPTTFQAEIYAAASGGACACADGSMGTLSAIPLEGGDGVTNPFTIAGATGGICRLPVDRSGYYRFEFSMMEGFVAWDQYYLALTVYGTNGTVQFLPIPGLDLRAAEISGLRVLGASVMISVDSAAIAKGGVAVGYQVPDSELPTAYVPFSSSTDCTVKIYAVNGNVQNNNGLGMYGWSKATGEESYDFRYPFRFAEGRTSASSTTATVKNLDGYYAELYPHGGWTMVAVQAPPSPVGGTTGFAGGIYRVTHAVSLNISTGSVWYSLAPPPTVLVDMNALAVLLHGVPQFVDNPIHWDVIRSWLTRNSEVLKGFAKAGLVGLTGAFAPHLLPLTEAVNSLY